MPEVEIAREDVLGHLEQILANRRFASAERNARFLRFVVESALDGKAAEIKETVVATEVYGRSSDYDPKTDSIVRVEASRLRQKLKSYYENEGSTTAIRFHMPSGSYVPVFERREQAPVPDEALCGISEPAVVTVTDCIVPDGPKAYDPRRLVLACGVAALAFALSIQAARGSRPRDDAEGIAASQEGIALLHHDPHSGQSASGPPKTLLRAIERLEFAAARMPESAPTWTALAEAYDYSSAYVGRDSLEDARRCEAAARRAIVLDGKLAAGHHMLGLALKGMKWDFGEAEAAYRRALALDPRNAYAVIEYADLLLETGRVQLAAEEVRRARALLPAFPALAVKEAEIQLHQGRPDAAMATAKSALDLSRTYWRAYIALGMAHEMRGEFDAALAAYEHVLRSDPADRRALPAYGYLLARTGQTARAREVAADLEKINSTVRNVAFQIAVVYAGLGQNKLALDWLERAWHTRQQHFPFATVEYRFRGLHDNPRFLELLNREKLKPVAGDPIYLTAQTRGM
jgi:tetratricopeptide (TPR) repeat protein